MSFYDYTFGLCIPPQESLVSDMLLFFYSVCSNLLAILDITVQTTSDISLDNLLVISGNLREISCKLVTSLVNTTAALQTRSDLCISRKETVRPRSQCPNSRICELFIYSHDRSAYLFRIFGTVCMHLLQAISRPLSAMSWRLQKISRPL